MENRINLLFDNDMYGTLLITIDEGKWKIGFITTKASYKSIELSESCIMRYFDSAKKEQIKEFDKLLKYQTPIGRAFLSPFSYFTTIKNDESLKVESIKNLEVGEVYYNREFDQLIARENYVSALTYKGIFPGSLENFYDLYKEIMFEEALKAAGINNEDKEKELRAEFKEKMEKGLI